MENQNPLLAYSRRSQPILNLSSEGNFWPAGSIEKSNNIEVFPLTGQDELLLLSASSSLVGSILAEIISNCVPSIYDVWSMPRIDLDCIMIAIRCASYNNRMNIQFQCQKDKCNHTQSQSIDLLEVSQQIRLPKYDLPYSVGNIKLWLKPLTFHETFQESADQSTKFSVIQKLSEEGLSDDEKKKLAVESLSDITKINVRSMARSIKCISIGEDISVENAEYINEWLSQCDRETFSEIKKAIDECNSEYQLPQKHFNCEKCNHTNTVDIEFNPADFLKKGD